MTAIENCYFLNGSSLLQRWPAVEAGGKKKKGHFFDAAIAGEFDENFKALAPAYRVHSAIALFKPGLVLSHDLYCTEVGGRHVERT